MDILIIGEPVVVECPVAGVVARGYLLGLVDADSARVLEPGGLVSTFPVAWCSPEYGADVVLVAQPVEACEHQRLACRGYLDLDDGTWVQEWRCMACMAQMPTPIPEDYWEALMDSAADREDSR